MRMIFFSGSGLLTNEVNFICRSCSRRLLSIKSSFPIRQRRSISQAWLRKTDEAKQAWDVQAEKIEAGKKDSMLTTLEKRGYINAVAGDRNTLDQLMVRKRIGAYVGFDPTAPSLHVGHLLPLMALFWMYVHGFHTVTLLGGATAQIGDPTGRSTSREQQHSSVRKANMVSMHYQLKIMWQNMEHHARFTHGYQWEWAWHRELVNNNTWMNKLPALELLKVLGSGTRVGAMLGRDTVKTKMESGDGISFSEFTYPLLQAWDWWHMYNSKGIQLQIGGSDQFGNIIAGMDAINYIRKSHYDPDIRQEKEVPFVKPMGFTVPLLTTSSGEKFGKSAGNAVWLDKDMTSTFELYQYFLRLPDADVGRYLRLFTFIPLSEIDEIVASHGKDPSKRTAQRRLAYEVVSVVHGAEAVKDAELQHSMLFRPALPTKTTASNDAKAIPKSSLLNPNATHQSLNVSLNPSAPHITAANSPSSHLTLPRSLIYNQPISRVLFAAGLVGSRSEGHRLASNQGAYIGAKHGSAAGMGDELSFSPIVNWKPEETAKYVIDSELLILRIGKWKVRIIKIVSDETFDERGLDAPGWREWKEGQNVDRGEEYWKKVEKDAEENKPRVHNALKVIAREHRRKGTRSQEAEQRFQEFMQERYSAKSLDKAPTYTEWLRREKELEEEMARKASGPTIKRIGLGDDSQV